MASAAWATSNGAGCFLNNLASLRYGRKRQLTITATMFIVIVITVTAVTIVFLAATSAATGCNIASTAIDNQGPFTRTSPLSLCSGVMASCVSNNACLRGAVFGLHRSSRGRVRAVTACAISVPSCRDGNSFPLVSVQVPDGTGGIIRIFEFCDRCALDLVWSSFVQWDITAFDPAIGLEEPLDCRTDGTIRELSKEDRAVWRNDGSI